MCGRAAHRHQGTEKDVKEVRRTESDRYKESDSGWREIRHPDFIREMGDLLI